MEIEVQTPYDTKVGAGPIITGRNWRSSPRMNKIGAFSFEMPLNDPRRSYLVQKRYVRCYGMVDGMRTELGKPGIIDSVVKEVDANGVPTGMLRVSGRDLFAELADITIHELSLIDTSARIPDSVQYYDGTETAYIDMTDTYDDNPATSVEIPADDEDWHYVGDADPWDLTTWDFGANLNSDTNNFIVQYSTGVENTFSSGTILSDTTKVDNASFAQDGAIRWERQEDWATQTNNGVDDMYWLRFRYKEDMSGDVTINEITITQDIPTATALADWLAYTDAAAGTPISDLGWDFWATHQATENTVFLILRDVSAFEALTLIAEQTGENFRLGTGRLIDWLQNDKTASGIRATNISDGIAAEDNEDICLITNLRQTEDSYEMISRIYPQGGGRGDTRITLLECTESAPAGYTLSKSANYLKKDSVEVDYGRRIEMTKFWPGLASPRRGNSRDANSANALYKLAYEYLERHCTPQTSYIFSVVKLDAAVGIGETIQLVYWQTVEGTAVWNLGITAALHLWVLEMTHAVDDAGSRVVGMQVATIDAWPASDASKVKRVVSQIKALQSTDGPIGAASLTSSSVAALLASLDLSAYAKLASDETVTGTWTHTTGLIIGTETALSSKMTGPGITIQQGAYDTEAIALQSSDVAHGMTSLADTDTYWFIRKAGDTSGGADLVGLKDADGVAGSALSVTGYLGENADTTKDTTGRAIVEVWAAIADGAGYGNINADGNAFGVRGYRGGAWVTLLLVDEDADLHVLNDIELTNDLRLADGAVVGIPGNEIITFNAAGTIAITGADVTMGADLTVSGGLNVGTATGAAVNQIAVGAPISSMMTIGITINQAGNDDEIVAFQSSDVAHGATNLADTDTFGSINKLEGNSGGLRIRGLKDADGVAYGGLVFQGMLAENPDTTKDGTGLGVFQLEGYQTSGVGVTNMVANGNVVAMRTYRGGAYTTLWILDEDGDVFIDGVQDTYDEFDDAVMAWDATRVLADRGGEILRYNKDALVNAGIMSPAGWISQRGTTKLLMGAVGQLSQRNQELEARVLALEAA